MTRISSIYSRAHADPPTGAEAERRNAETYQRMWQERGVFCVDPSTIDDPWVQQAVINLAEKRYLKRQQA